MCFLLIAVVAAAANGCARKENAQSVDSSVAGTNSVSSTSQTVEYGIPKSRERFEIQKTLISNKLEQAVLPAMRNQGIDMWVMLDRENNSDPLHAELGGGYSGVRSAFIFFDNGSDTPEKIYYGSHEQAANSVVS
jgi:hypothetical protein